ncbi:CLUMA_CG003964, isoform A [Clunio marinus]|uniref:CLUMA_CG003964, isoform A n=1 Tax=Clunio marinus TaxID=568069 RepID=A0A1J1HQD2_9DIPT|nr:CLUMA_CG003964, isoform A [Clunio marinus]
MEEDNIPENSYTNLNDKSESNATLSSENGNEIVEEDLKKLSPNFVENRLDIKEKLNFYNSQCFCHSTQKVSKVLKVITEGTDFLNLDDYCIATLQCKIMFDTFIMNPITPLIVISLKNNQIEPFGIDSLSEFVARSESLEQLILESSKIGSEGAKILSSGISISTSIVYLNLVNCNIDDNGGEILIKSFTTNHVCQELNLSKNFLSFKTALAFQDVCEANKSLVKLDLSHNSFYEDNAIDILLKSLQGNETVSHLDLSWNGLGGESFAKSLLKAIKLSKLRSIKLEYNRMGKFEIKKLAVGVRKSETIEEVYIGGNLLSKENDSLLINVFQSDSPLNMISYGRWYHLSRDAYSLLQDIRWFKPSIKVIFKDVILPNPPKDVNMLDIYADRAKFLAMSPKKKKLQKDFGAFMRGLLNLPSSYLEKLEFLDMIEKSKMKHDVVLIDQYCDECSVLFNGRKTVDVHLMANHYLSRHPYTPKKKTKKKGKNLSNFNDSA